MTIAALTVTGLYNRHISTGLQTGDAAAPSYVITPEIVGVGENYIQVGGSATDLNPPIILYVVAVADAAGAPTAAQVKAGTDSLDAAAPKGSNTAGSGEFMVATIAGLTANTAYDVYYTMEDNLDNLVVSAKLDQTTLAASVYDPNDTVRSIASGSRMVRPVADDIT